MAYLTELTRLAWTRPDPCASLLPGKTSLLLVFHFLEQVTFSAPHQGCKPPTSADIKSTPRARGRVIGKNGLAQDAEGQEITRTGDPNFERLLHLQRECADCCRTPNWFFDPFRQHSLSGNAFIPDSAANHEIKSTNRRGYYSGCSRASIARRSRSSDRN